MLIGQGRLRERSTTLPDVSPAPWRLDILKPVRAFLGPAVYIVARDYLARQTPEYWYMGIGVLLVIIVLFARGGILGLFDAFAKKFLKRKS